MSKTLRITLLYLLLQTNLAYANTTHLEAVAEKYNDNIVSQIGAKSIGEFIKRTKESTILSHLQVNNLKTGSTSTFEVNWLINRKRISRSLQKIIPLYQGEKPSITDTRVKQITNKRNNLYFYYKPLGQTNGLTFDLSKNNKLTQYYREILKDFSVFIRVQVNKTIKYIPIGSPAPLSGCGNILEKNTSKLWCLQTSPPIATDYGIGYLNGLSHKLSIDSEIKSKDEITIEWLITYKGEKV